MPMKIAVATRQVEWPPRRASVVRATIAAVAACALVTGCALGRGGPSKVASGEIYEPGERTYDEFFKALYAEQLLMGQAPDRERAVKQKLTKVAGVAETASADELSNGIEKKLDDLAKKSVAAKVSTTGLDGNDPAARVVAVGTAGATTDDESVRALELAVKDGIGLLTDLRHAKPELARLKEALPPLEPKVDTAFSRASSGKKAEVRKNLADAERLIPLMMSRGDEVDARVVELFRALEKASPAAVAAPPSTLGDASAKKKDKKAAQPKAPGEPKPKPKHADAPPAEPKPKAAKPADAEPKAAKPAEPAPKAVKPKPSEDFEP
jgi:hypothetical protein